MFQSKVGTFNFKSNPHRYSLNLFSKCLRFGVYTQISLYTNLPYACLSTYPPLFRLHNYMNQEVF